MLNQYSGSAFLVLLTFCISSASGCNQADVDNGLSRLTENTSNIENVVTSKPPVNAASKIAREVVSEPEFAPTVEGERIGLWLGGSPPINKRASGIKTYYQLKTGNKPNHLLMKLRFEGVVANDALVRFKAIDGARFDPSDQRFEWRLKPNIASEISFGLIVPDTTSYLSLLTFQNNSGSSRAFLLSK